MRTSDVGAGAYGVVQRVPRVERHAVLGRGPERRQVPSLFLRLAAEELRVARSLLLRCAEHRGSVVGLLRGGRDGRRGGAGAAGALSPGTRVVAVQGAIRGVSSAGVLGTRGSHLGPSDE